MVPLNRRAKIEGPGKRGEVIQVCADSACAIHGKPNHRAEQEAASQQREEKWRARQQELAANQQRNRKLLDSVLIRIPKVLKRANYETLLFALIERLESDDWEAIAERYKIDTDNIQEPDAASFELRKMAATATDSQLIRMLFELALLPFGYSDEQLDHLNPLASAATRYDDSVEKTAQSRVRPHRTQVAAKAGKSRKPKVKQKPRGKVAVGAA